ncbi:MAG: glycine oxidase ThiO [Actinomycetes bacterium]
MPAKGVTPVPTHTAGVPRDGARNASRDTVVLGGGVIGLAVAWRLAQRGLGVTVVDPTPGEGASFAAAGMLAPVTEVHYGEERLLDLTLRAARGYAAFAAELAEASGLSPGYRETGTLAVALDTDDKAVLEDLRTFQTALGLETAALTGRECRRLEPMLTPSVRGGLLVPGDHSVDNRRLTAALLGAGERSGVTLRRSHAVEVVTDGDRVRGVRLDDGDTLDTGTLVLAAGCWSGRLPGLPPEALPPIRPVKGQILRLRTHPDRPFVTRTVRGLVRGSGVYLVPREDGEVVVGGTVEELGFDTTVTAGGVYDLLRDARTLLPGVTELTLVETHAGLRPGSPDNAPVLGPSPLDGLVLATGHYRNGILLAAVTADAIADVVTTGALPSYAEPFAPSRFAALEVFP